MERWTEEKIRSKDLMAPRGLVQGGSLPHSSAKSCNFENTEDGRKTER